MSQLIEQFHLLHEQLYTFCDRQAEVEIVNLRVKAIGVVDKFDLSLLNQSNGTQPKSAGERNLYFSNRGFKSTPVYNRDDLLAGHELKGPAIIDQLDTTTVIFPGDMASVDQLGSISIEIHND